MLSKQRLGFALDSKRKSAVPIRQSDQKGRDMNNDGFHKLIIIALMGMLCWFGWSVTAQTPPSDLTELSLEQILGLRIVNRNVVVEGNYSLPETKQSDKWSVGYRYIRLEFSGHRDGTDNLSDSEVLFPGGAAVRTSNNYPIVPTEIRQEAHVTELGFSPNEKFSVNILVPYITQETEHISIVPGFSDFAIHSEGIGDISVTPSLIAWKKSNHVLTLNAGLSLPVGAINETGDTPAPGSVNPLPYTMQLGSGTFDFLPGISYFGARDRLTWGAQTLGTIRLGRNYRGYTLGNRLSLQTWLRVKAFDWMEPSMALSAQIWDRIEGVDTSFKAFALPGAFFPASVADPIKFGGEKVSILPGIRFSCPRGALKGHTLAIGGGLPVYQRLNGPQPEEDWQINVSWNWSF